MAQTSFKRIPFNIALAKKITNKEVEGQIVTRNGLKARIVCFDFKYLVGKKGLAVLVEHGDYEVVLCFNTDGKEIFRENRDIYNLHIEIPTYYEDYSNFEPDKWQPCLVRENEDEIWLLQVSKGKRCGDGVLFYCPDGSTNVWRHCLPISKVTQRLIGTTKSYEQLIKELDAELTVSNKTRITMGNEEFDFHEIKTFEDACRHLGISEDTELLVTFSGDTEAFLQANMFYKLMIIQKAMNNGVWRDKDGLSYYPYWEFYSKEGMERMSEEKKQKRGIKQLISCAVAFSTECAGVRCATPNARGALANTYCGFPLCFNSEEAALYAAHQFEDLFFQYYGIKVKS